FRLSRRHSTMNRTNPRMIAPVRRVAVAILLALLGLVAASLAGLPAALAQTSAVPAAAPHAGGGEARLVVPDLGQVRLLGMNGRTLLMSGLLVCGLGLVFGLVIFGQLRGLPVHDSMREISELIYETCKTYLITQGKFILLLEVFIGCIIVLYFGLLL